ncbi:MAG TPA: hypothetical protein VI386_35280 [Candidatus Sulfotelmatobacter sp.]
MRNALASPRVPLATPTPHSSTNASQSTLGHNSQEPVSGAVSVLGRHPTVSIRYVDSSAIRLKGPVTGQPYVFSGARPTPRVDSRDAAVLIRNGLFRRVTPSGGK